MSRSKISSHPKGSFHLNKWFLDFIGEDGDAMIFYAAELTWYGIKIPYCNWLHCNASGKVNQTSGFRQINFPELENNIISWHDSRLGIKGTWEKLVENVQTRVFESNEGNLDWYCYQPASKTILTIDNKTYQGNGYVEQLVSTVPVWKVPMDELRWGHIFTENTNIVWIEIKSNENKRWLWFNGRLTEDCIIDDSQISIPPEDMVIQFDRSTVLESEKKLSSLADKLVKYIPGIRKLVPVHFLLADEKKWLSNVKLLRNNKVTETGFAIHEHVNFKSEVM